MGLLSERLLNCIQLFFRMDQVDKRIMDKQREVRVIRKAIMKKP